jgi:DNA-dependent RNA polymerase auxiliary subunit epsilon
MEKSKAVMLRDSAEELAKVFSNPNREYNGQNETFKVDKITPMSDLTAVVTYRKSTGKFAVQFWFWVKDRWWSFFPTDSHIEGMRHMIDAKVKIEQANFGFNFETTPKPKYDSPYTSGHEYD